MFILDYIIIITKSNFAFFHFQLVNSYIYILNEYLYLKDYQYGKPDTQLFSI